MLRKKVWQRGSADLVSVAVGMTVLAIVLAGTAAAMVYGRDLTTYEEHYKAAAFALRGVMEECQGELQYVPEASLQESLNSVRFMRRVDLDQAIDRNGVNGVVTAVMSRDRVEAVDLMETGAGVDFYVVTVRANWIERNGMTNEIVYRTGIFAQRAL